MTRQEFIEKLVEDSEGELTESRLSKLSPKGLLRTWLHWEGIRGYTEDILQACEALGLPETDDRKKIAELEEQIRSLTEERDKKRGPVRSGTDLRGKLVLQIYNGGKWENLYYAEDTTENMEWLAAKYQDYDNPDMRIELFT